MNNKNRETTSPTNRPRFSHIHDITFASGLINNPIINKTTANFKNTIIDVYMHRRQSTNANAEVVSSDLFFASWIEIIKNQTPFF